MAIFNNVPMFFYVPILYLLGTLIAFYVSIKYFESNKDSSRSILVNAFWLYYYPTTLSAVSIALIHFLKAIIGQNELALINFVIILLINFLFYLPVFPQFFDRRVGAKNLRSYLWQTLVVSVIGILILATYFGVSGVGIVFTIIPGAFIYHLVTGTFVYQLYKGKLNEDVEVSRHPFLTGSSFFLYLILISFYGYGAYHAAMREQSRVADIKTAESALEKELLGEDKNENLIRDDVEAWIEKEYSDKPAISNALRMAGHFSYMQFKEFDRGGVWAERLQHQRTECLQDSISSFYGREESYEKMKAVFLEFEAVLYPTKEHKVIATESTRRSYTTHVQRDKGCFFPLNTIDPNFFDPSISQKSKTLSMLNFIIDKENWKDVDKMSTWLDEIELKYLWPDKHEDLFSIIISTNNKILIDQLLVKNSKYFLDFSNIKRITHPDSIFESISLENVKYLLDREVFKNGQFFEVKIEGYDEGKMLNLLEVAYLYNRHDILEFSFDLYKDSKNYFSLLTARNTELTYHSLNNVLSKFKGRRSLVDPDDKVQKQFQEMFRKNITIYNNDERLEFLEKHPEIKGRDIFHNYIKGASLYSNKPDYLYWIKILSDLEMIPSGFVERQKYASFVFEDLPKKLRSNTQIQELIRESNNVKFRDIPEGDDNFKGKLIAQDQLLNKPSMELLCGKLFNDYASAFPDKVTWSVKDRFFSECSDSKDKRAAFPLAKTSMINSKNDLKRLEKFLSPKELELFINFETCYYYKDLNDYTSKDSFKTNSKQIVNVDYFEASESKSCLEELDVKTRYRRTSEDLCGYSKGDHNVIIAWKVKKINRKELSSKLKIPVDNIHSWVRKNYQSLSFDSLDCDKALVEKNIASRDLFMTSERAACEVRREYFRKDHPGMISSASSSGVDRIVNESYCLNDFVPSSEAFSNECEKAKNDANVDYDKGVVVRLRYAVYKGYSPIMSKVKILKTYDCSKGAFKI